MSAMPEAFGDLLTKRKAFASLATINADGTSQGTPVWFDWDRYPNRKPAEARVMFTIAPDCIQAMG